MTIGDLPPNSNVTGTKLAATAEHTFFATAVEPVYNKWSNGRDVKFDDVSTPPLMTTISSSVKYLFTNSSKSFDVIGTNSDNFIMALFPAANTSIKGPSDSEIGKFHGAIIPTTPNGWKCTCADDPRRLRGNLAFLFSGLIQVSSFFNTCLA